MDLVVLLPTTTVVYDAAFTLIDRFYKLVKFTPCIISIIAAQLAQLFIE